ncbi:MAG: imelysin family protein [Persicimonas sp.]
MKHHIAQSLIALTCTAVILSAACGDDEEDFDRGQMLTDIGQNTMMATNDDFLEAADDFEETAQTFCDDPSEDALADARDGWRAVKQPLKRMESFGFGPYRSERVAMDADKWPGRADNIENIIDSTDEYDEIDVETVDGLDYTDRVKGYPAAGYLLHGAPDDGEALDAFQADDEAAERRCDYLEALADQSQSVAADYHEAWASDGGGYVDDFTNAGPESDPFPSEQDAVTDMMGGMLYALDQISIMKLGVPAGLVDAEGEETDGEASPEDVEAPHSQSSVEHAAWTLEGVERIYLGDGDDLALTHYVQDREASGDVDQTVRDRLEEAKAAIDDLDEPLGETVEDDPDAVQDAIDSVDALNRALSSDVSTLLGINPTTVEGDND